MWQFWLWAGLVSAVNCVCNQTSGDAEDIDYEWLQNNIELTLCCNRTVLEATWQVDSPKDGVRYVRKLTYSCSDNQMGTLSKKVNYDSATVSASITGVPESCIAELSYRDWAYNNHKISTKCFFQKDYCASNPCKPTEICASAGENFTCTCHSNFDSSCTSCEHGYYLFNNDTECICDDGNLRLVEGATAVKGLVEVCYNNQYGAVCADSWNVSETRVACRQLGFNNDSVTISKESTNSSLLHWNYVQCEGNESSLRSCKMDSREPSHCEGEMRVGVICESKDQLSHEPKMSEDNREESTEVVFAERGKDDDDYTNHVLQDIEVAESKKILELVCFTVGGILMMIFIGISMAITFLFSKRYCTKTSHGIKVEPYFKQDLDMNFEPVDVKKSIPVSSSIFSLTTIVCQMEKAEFTKAEQDLSISPVVEHYSTNSQIP